MDVEKVVAKDSGPVLRPKRVCHGCISRDKSISNLRGELENQRKALTKRKVESRFFFNFCGILFKELGKEKYLELKAQAIALTPEYAKQQVKG